MSLLMNCAVHTHCEERTTIKSDLHENVCVVVRESDECALEVWLQVKLPNGKYVETRFKKEEGAPDFVMEREEY